MASNTSGGKYEHHYLAEPDSALQCVICLEVAEDPRQHEACGRLLCKECLEKYGRDKPCPNCRMEHPQYFQDNRGKREIKALRVKCSNVGRRCEWEGTVGTLEEHVATCKFTLVPCPKHCKDDNNEVEHFMRKDLDTHLKKDCPNRDYECEHCGEKGTYAHITQVHDKECKKKKLPCPNAECAELIERQYVNGHVRTKCLYTVIACIYQGIGCEAELKRKDMAAHEQDDKLHLHMAIDTVNSQQEAINSQQKAINSQKEDINSQQKAISSLQEVIKSIQTVTLKDKKSITFELPKFQKRKDAGEMFTSRSFYTSANGYHMALRVYVNGNGAGKGTHVSVHAPILDGKYDAGLKWPFIGTITFTLLNQLEDKNHHTAILSLDAADNAKVGDAWGIPTFIPHSELAHDPVKNTQYLKDDTLYFRVSVEVADHKSWLEYTAKQTP